MIIGVIALATNGTSTWGVMPQQYVNGLSECSEHIQVRRVEIAPIKTFLPMANIGGGIPNNRINKDVLKQQIIHSLQNDIPVTINYGLLGYYEFIYSDSDNVYEKRTGGHYVNITEYIIDTVVGKEFFKIGTWANAYYLAFDNFYNQCGLFGSAYFYEVN